MLTKHTSCYKNVFGNKNICIKIKSRLKNTTVNKTLTYATETWTLTMRDGKQMNIFERKVHRRILGPVYDNENENWRVLTFKRRIKSRLPFAGNIRSSPYSPL